MTEQGKKELEAELAELKNKKEKEINEEIKNHHSFCDFSDNASFDQMLDEQALLKKRINEIQDIIAYAEIIPPKEANNPTIQLGDTVYFRELPDGPREKYRLVGSSESEPLNNKLSIDSPIGQALVNREVGNKITLEVPAGTVTIEILEIE